MEEKVFIPAGDIQLEAVLHAGDPARAGVTAHPHPLYGGNMHNNVVFAAIRALAQAGWTGLRFNFRGTGQSTGGHDQGQGEQEDVAAAASFLQQRGADRLVVVGYSFGAWVAAFAWPRLKKLGVLPLVLIAPPAAFVSFEGLPADTEIGLMICGEQDDIGPPRLADELAASLDRPPRTTVIPGASHMFGGRETELTRVLAEYLSEDR